MSASPCRVRITSYNVCYTKLLRKVSEYRLDQVCEILFSPSYEQQDARELADWILADRLPVRMQIQLHKVLWHDERGR